MAAYSAAVFLALFSASCSFFEKKAESVAEARIVVGKVSYNRGGESFPVSVGTQLISNDLLVTAEASKAKISSGSINIFVNEGASLRFLPPTEAESCVVVAEKGAYYFSVPAGRRAMQCRFGDMAISVASGTDASLAIDESGRLAEFWVLGGYAQIRRSGETKKVSACEVAVLDAAGISKDSTLAGERSAALARLKGWVGETIITAAAASGKCNPDSESVAPAKEIAAPPPAKDTVKPVVHVPIDTMKPVIKPPTTNTPAEGFMIEHIVGPRRIYVGESFTLKCAVTGSAPVTHYLWRFKGVDDSLVTKTETPQVAAVLEKTGDYVVICDIMGDNGILASQTVRVQVVVGRVTVSAGGPYKAMLNSPLSLHGSAVGHKGNIARYEWYITHNGGKPDYVLTENAAVSHTFTKSGNYKAVFAARLTDGSTVSDTAVFTVGSRRPTANAGADAAPKSDGKVRLKGTGSSPDGKIVKYEWDFNGDGVYDWSSESPDEIEHVFTDYAKPVFRVTDTEGNTAVDTMRVVICPSDMATVESGKFCVDKFEWPNKRGAAPLTEVTWQEAAKTCESVGKRLCAPEEWKRACRNGAGERKPADGSTYPYGGEFGNTKCNTLDNPKSRNALLPAGMFGECVGSLGVYDMSGNAAEWTASSSANAQAFGGFYQSGAEESACESGVALDKSKKYLYVGFRCCK